MKSQTSKSLFSLASCSLLAGLLIAGCDSGTTTTTTPQPLPAADASEPAESVAEPAGEEVSEMEPSAEPVRQMWDEGKVHEAIYAKNPEYTGKAQMQIENGLVLGQVLPQANVKDISMLKGMPLLVLDLQGNPVSDISALKGMPLLELFLDKSFLQT